jgi:hypothetical protein
MHVVVVVDAGGRGGGDGFVTGGLFGVEPRLDVVVGVSPGGGGGAAGNAKAFAM